MNVSLSLNELNVTERISQSSSIATALVNITTSTQEPIYAEDINIAVDIVSTLNKYDHLFMCTSRPMLYCYYYSVTETVASNLTTNDTLLNVSITSLNYRIAGNFGGEKF